MHPHPLVFTFHPFGHVHGLVFRRLCMEMRGSKQLSNPDYWNSAFAGASSGLLLHGLLGTFTTFFQFGIKTNGPLARQNLKPLPAVVFYSACLVAGADSILRQVMSSKF